MSSNEANLSSDQALESLLAKTRADLTSRALGEMDRVNEDLNALLYRVRGSRRDQVGAGYARPVSPGARGAATRALLAGVDLDVLGVPERIAAERPGTLDELVALIEPALPRAAHPGQVVVVIATQAGSADAVQTARRLAARTPGPAHVILGGAKTAIPGTLPRVRGVDELAQVVGANGDTTTYLVLVDSQAATHARTTEKLAEAADPCAVWALVSARGDQAACDEWLWHLPGGLQASDLAVTEIWEADAPAAVLGLSTRVGMLDLAPATAEMWRVVLATRLREEGWRG